VKKVKKRTFYLFGLLIILFLGSSIVLGGDAGYCPDPFSKVILDQPQEEVLTLETNFSIPRNQVLLEIITATW
jgi:hypothetical protein